MGDRLVNDVVQRVGLMMTEVNDNSRKLWKITALMTMLMVMVQVVVGVMVEVGGL